MDYNGMYTATFSIQVKAETHRGCLFAYNQFKYLAKAMNFGDISIYESKSARKGDVLSRDLTIVYTQYASSVILLQGAINHILFAINNHYRNSVSAILYRSHIVRENAIRDFIKDVT